MGYLHLIYRRTSVQPAENEGSGQEVQEVKHKNHIMAGIYTPGAVMNHENQLMAGIYALGAAGIILSVFFLLAVSGAEAYRGIAEAQAGNNNDRALLSFITTSVKSGDAEGAVRVHYAEGSPVISIEDADAGYGMQIYRHGGELLGSYGKIGSELNPKDAFIIGRTGKFQVRDLGNGAYEAVTDAGRVLFHVRCGSSALQGYGS